MDRRDFLKTLAVTGAVMTVQRSEAMDILAQKVDKMLAVARWIW